MKKKTKKPHKCKVCGKKFVPKPYRNGKCCSLSCWRSRGLGYSGGLLKIKCPVCKKAFKILRAVYLRKKHREIRCSPECYRKRWLSLRQPEKVRNRVRSFVNYKTNTL